MKIEIPIEAPCAGRLVELPGAGSEPVPEGPVVVAVLEVR